MKFSHLACIVYSLFLVASPHSFAINLRTSAFGEDIVMRQTLFNAMTASAAAGVQNLNSENGQVTLAYGNDSLACTVDACTLKWDSVSPNSNQPAGVFEASLYDILDSWTTGAGANDPSIKRSVYAETGDVQILILNDAGNLDSIKCSLLNLSLGAPAEKTCSIVVSDYTAGTSTDLQSLWSTFLSTPSYISSEIEALLNTVKGSDFVAASSSFDGNGEIQSTRTLSTDLAVDEITVSENFAYVTPILNDEGLPLLDGINIAISGTQDSFGSDHVGAVQSSPYALSVVIP